MARYKITGLLCALGIIMATPLASDARDINFFAQAPVRAWHGDRFTVTRIDSFDEFDGFRAMLENWTGTFPDQVAALQAAILANRPLASALRARNVQIRNVVAMQQALSGNLIFYLR